MRHATERSLVIMDELGRATSTAGAAMRSHSSNLQSTIRYRDTKKMFSCHESQQRLCKQLAWSVRPQMGSPSLGRSQST